MLQLVKQFALFVFCPGRLVDEAVRETIGRQRGGKPMEPDRKAELESHFRRQFGGAIRRMRWNFGAAALLVLSAVALALGAGAVLAAIAGPLSGSASAALQIGGVGVLLWATLARAESAVETFDGGTIPEHLDYWLYRGLYWCGTFAICLALAW